LWSWATAYALMAAVNCRCSSALHLPVLTFSRLTDVRHVSVGSLAPAGLGGRTALRFFFFGSSSSPPPSPSPPSTTLALGFDAFLESSFSTFFLDGGLGVGTSLAGDAGTVGADFRNAPSGSTSTLDSGLWLSVRARQSEWERDFDASRFGSEPSRHTRYDIRTGSPCDSSSASTGPSRDRSRPARCAHCR